MNLFIALCNWILRPGARSKFLDPGHSKSGNGPKPPSKQHCLAPVERSCCQADLSVEALVGAGNVAASEP